MPMGNPLVTTEVPPYDTHTTNHLDVKHNNEDPKYNNPLNGKSIIFWGPFVCMVKWAPRKDC